MTKISSDRNPLNVGHLLDQHQKGEWEPVLMRAALFVLICAIRDHPECEDIFRMANFRDQIARSIQCMEVHPFRDWTVSALAKKVGMSRSAFASRFFIEMGKPPMATLTDLRMDIAEQLLTRTNLKVTEVARRVGYSSESAFLRRFIKHFHTAPSNMRTSLNPTTGRNGAHRQISGLLPAGSRARSNCQAATH